MAATRERKVPALVDKPMDFCPGCGHGIVSRLIMEALEELGQMTENELRHFAYSDVEGVRKYIEDRKNPGPRL